MDTNLNKDLFGEIRRLMIENEQKLMQMNSFEDKNIPLSVKEVYDEINAMKKLPRNNAHVVQLNKFISDIANSIKLFSTHFANFAHCPEGSINENILKEKADYHLEQTKKLYDEYTKNLPNFTKHLTEQIYHDLFAVSIKAHPTVSMVATDGSNIALCGNVKKSVTKLVNDAKLKQQESRQQNAMSWFIDEMYDYIINGNISANAKNFISSYTSKKIFKDNTYSLSESQLTNSEFKNKATKTTYYIRDKKYSFKDEVTFTNFMSTRQGYFDSIMQGIDYTNISNLSNIAFNLKNGKSILNQSPEISYALSEDYKTYLAMQAYSANRNMVLTSKYEYDRGFIRDGSYKYEI